MDFNLTDEQQMLRDSARRFVRERYGFEARRALEQSDAGWSAEHWQTYAELGWLALGLPEHAGGLGFGLTDTCLLTEALGQGLVLEPFISTAVLCARILERAGDAALCTPLLGAVAGGELRLALAHEEPGVQHQRCAATTTARRNASGYVLSGSKTMVLDAPSAHRFIVSACVHDEPGLALFLVDAQAPGLRLQPYTLIDGSRAGDLLLDGIELPPTALLVPQESGSEVLDEALDRATVARVAEALGAMDAVLRITSDYLKTRQQFGQPIGKFQALQHRMAEMFVEVEATQSILFQALACIDAAPVQRAAAVSVAKVVAAQAGRFVGGQGIQLHGGMGMTAECAVGHYFKRLVVIDRSYGDAEWHLQRMAALRKHDD